MTADPLPRADRARKARRSSVVACGHYVLTGQVIVRRGGRWTCLACALAAIGATTTTTGGQTTMSTVIYNAWDDLGHALWDARYRALRALEDRLRDLAITEPSRAGAVLLTVAGMVATQREMRRRAMIGPRPAQETRS